jgi:hypothetical protein
MELVAPESLQREHEDLHAELVPLLGLGGKVGPAAQAVAEALHAHFPQEEKYAMPPLGLLAPLAEGRFSPDMAAVLPLTDTLKADFPRLLAEHRQIVSALAALAAAGQAENQPAAVAFAEKLRLHAQNEEQVLYPAAILVGEYVRLRQR